MITKRAFILRGSCFCEKYSTCSAEDCMLPKRCVSKHSVSMDGFRVKLDVMINDEKGIRLQQ